MSTTFEVKDSYGDILEVEVRDKLFLTGKSDDDDEGFLLGFNDQEKDRVQQVRDALTAWIGDEPKASGVRAADLTFNEAVIRLAILHNKVVCFAYKKPTAERISSRRVAPSSIRDGKVVGYDHDRSEVRSFRLDRIQGDVAFD